MTVIDKVYGTIQEYETKIIESLGKIADIAQEDKALVNTLDYGRKTSFQGRITGAASNHFGHINKTFDKVERNTK